MALPAARQPAGHQARRAQPLTLRACPPTPPREQTADVASAAHHPARHSTALAKQQPSHALLLPRGSHCQLEHAPGIGDLEGAHWRQHIAIVDAVVCVLGRLFQLAKLLV